MTSVCVVMPAYNEQDGIASFLEELNDSLSGYSVSFVVVNDCSQDATADSVSALASTGFPVILIENDVNSGHGPSTMNALRAGLASGADIVVATDGDGQFLGSDVAALVAMMAQENWDVIEGVRTSRTDPVYRKVSTAVTRGLVWSRARTLPQDANTPMRVYRRKALATLIDLVPSRAMTPNLFMSMLTRRRGLAVAEVAVRSIPRRGAEAIGSTWGRGSLLPSKRFVTFCAAATREWFTTPVR